RARLPHHGDRDRLDGPRRVACPHGPDPDPGRARAGRGAPARAERGQPRPRGRGPAVRGARRDVTRKASRRTGHRPVLAQLRKPRLDRFEVGVLVALFALSVAPLAGLLLRVWTKGGVVTGADGFLVADPMQYLTWLREASHHVAVANLYDLAPGPRSFVHPGVLVSGALHAIGFGVAAAYLAWKPFAVLALFAGARALARRFLPRRDDRRLALVVALFFASPLAALVSWLHIGPNHVKFDVDFVTGELW